METGDPFSLDHWRIFSTYPSSSFFLRTDASSRVTGEEKQNIGKGEERGHKQRERERERKRSHGPHHD